MTEKHYEQITQKIEPINGSSPSRQIQPQVEIEDLSSIEAAQKIKFDDALRQVESSKNVKPSSSIEFNREVVQGDALKPSPMDVVRTQQSRKTASVSQIQNQALELKEAFQRPRATLMGIGNEMHISSGNLNSMNGRLEHVDSALRDAAQGVTGVEQGSLLSQEKPALHKFLSFLTDGDQRVSTIIDDISKLKLKEQRLSPEILMSVQIKLGFVQQELEFFTNVLNKSLESTKTIMNVQI